MKKFLSHQVTVLEIIVLFAVLLVTNTIRYFWGKTVHFDQFFNDAFCSIGALAFYYFMDSKNGK